MKNLIRHRGQLLLAIPLILLLYLAAYAMYMNEFARASAMVGGALIFVWLLLSPELYDMSFRDWPEAASRSKYFALGVIGFLIVIADVFI